VTELELLGILFAKSFQKFKIYILGHPINLYTNHKALTFLFTSKLKSTRLTCWTLALQKYNLNIIHCPGKNNPIDTLSLHPLGREDQPPKDLPAILHYTVPPPIPPDIIPIFNNISVEQAKDKKIQKIISILNSNSTSPWIQYYTLKNNILFYRRFKYDANWSLYISNHLIKQVILLFHEYYAHVGPLKLPITLKIFTISLH